MVQASMVLAVQKVKTYVRLWVTFIFLIILFSKTFYSEHVSLFTRGFRKIVNGILKNLFLKETHFLPFCERDTIFLPTVPSGKSWHRLSNRFVSDRRARAGSLVSEALPSRIGPTRIYVQEHSSLEHTAVGLQMAWPSFLIHHPAGCVTSGALGPESHAFITEVDTRG